NFNFFTFPPKITNSFYFNSIIPPPAGFVNPGVRIWILDDGFLNKRGCILAEKKIKYIILPSRRQST
ncbi:hypothetical protein COS38_01250, partial [Candidatus Berkelbacteria bacterium CG03_land_8_20_14_0_80_40_36]